MGMKYSEGKDYKVVALLHSVFYLEETDRIMRKFVAAGKKNNIRFVFFSTFSELASNDVFDRGEATVFSLVDVARYDAVVIMSESFKQDKYLNELAARCKKAAVPVISVVKCLDNCINFIYDYGDTFGQIMEHLIEHHGYRRFAFMAGIKDNIFSEQRYEAFLEVLRAHNIDFDTSNLYYGGFWEIPCLEATDELLKKGIDDIDAIVCANDSMAITVINKLKQNGYSVPEDVAVTGFDGIELGEYCIPKLTTSAYNVDEFISYLTAYIKNNFAGASTTEPVTIFNAIKIGQSCGCPAQESKDASNELMHLKSETEKLIMYQIVTSQQMAALNDAKDFDSFMTMIGSFFIGIGYKDMYICCNDRMFNLYMGEERRHGRERNSRIRTYHYYNTVQADGKVCDIENIPSSLCLTGDFESLIEQNPFALVIPMHVRGMFMGYFVVNYEYGAFEELKFTSFVTSLRYILEIKSEQQKVMKVYLHDSLTGLYNRNGFYERIDELIEKGKGGQLSIISMDMDGLKRINDSLGHAEGDNAIIALGQIIRNCSEGELSARIGGDEFLIALTGNNLEERSRQIVRDIEAAIPEYNDTHSLKFTLNASIGSFTADIGNHTLDYFLRKADELMYKVKAQHGGRR